MERSVSIDIAKGLGICLVVLGHLPFPFCSFIYQFHMPLFFFLSGLCFKDIYNEKKISFIFKRFKSLMIPFFLIYIIAYLFIDHEPMHWSNLFSIKYHHNLLGTLWFLRDMFKCSVIVIFFSWINKKTFNKVCVLPLFFFLLAHVFSYFSIEGLSHIMYFGFFYTIAFVAKKLDGSMKIAIQCLICCLSFFTLIILSRYYHEIITTTTYKTFASYAIGALGGIYLVMSVSNAMKKNIYLSSFFSFIGRYTMPIMIFHFSIFYAVDCVLIFLRLDFFIEHDFFIKFVFGIFVPIIISMGYSQIITTFTKWLKTVIIKIEKYMGIVL